MRYNACGPQLFRNTQFKYIKYYQYTVEVWLHVLVEKGSMLFTVRVQLRLCKLTVMNKTEEWMKKTLFKLYICVTPPGIIFFLMYFLFLILLEIQL